VDKSYVVKMGPGAIAGALMLLERELGALLPERKTLSIFNCYQRAVKKYLDHQAAIEALPACNFDIKSLILAAFCHLPMEDIEDIEKWFKTRVLATVEQVVLAIKKVVSKATLPAFITWREEDGSDTEKLYALQSGVYDPQLTVFVSRYWIKPDQST
jgi:hypothetical protein